MYIFLKKVAIYCSIIFLIGNGFIYLAIKIEPGKALGNSTEFAMWSYKKQLINSANLQQKNVIIGDSRSLTALNPLIIGHNFINLSLGGTTAFEGYCMLKQMAKHHQIDTMIVSYGIFHFIESDVLEKWTLPYTLPSMDDLNALKKVEKIHGITIDNQTPDYFLFVKRMATYHHFPMLLRSTFIENLKQDEYNKNVINQLKNTWGFSNISRIDSCNQTNTEVELEKKQHKFIANPVISSYIDSIYNISVKKNIKVIFLIPPINKTSYNALVGKAFFNQFINFKKNLYRKYPLMVIDHKYVYLPNNYFSDPSHLNQRGSKFFSAYIKNNLTKY